MGTRRYFLQVYTNLDGNLRTVRVLIWITNVPYFPVQSGRLGRVGLPFGDWGRKNLGRHLNKKHNEASDCALSGARHVRSARGTGRLTPIVRALLPRRHPVAAVPGAGSLYSQCSQERIGCISGMAKKSTPDPFLSYFLPPPPVRLPTCIRQVWRWHGPSTSTRRSPWTPRAWRRQGSGGGSPEKDRKMVHPNHRPVRRRRQSRQP